MEDRKTELLGTINRNGKNLLEEVRDQVAAGTDLNHVAKYGQSPLRVASNNGRFDVVELLLQSGADYGQLEWTPLMFSVTLGDLSQMEADLQQGNGRENRDIWNRTPFLLAVLTGDITKCETLLSHGCNREARGRCGTNALQYAVQKNDLAMQRWLLDQGFPIDTTNELGSTALMDAAQFGHVESVRFLLEHGAELRRENNIPDRAIGYASTPEVAEVLLEYGEDIDAMPEETYAKWLGMRYRENPEATPQEYAAAKTSRFGRKNPEETNHPFWLAMIRSGANAYRARCHFDDNDCISSTQPVWCFIRFGRTTTRLPDSRIIVIAGEHEDYYDPDFCIYNDVTIFEPNGNIRLFSYPETLFPPTAFHTATLVDSFIYLIGGLGYRDQRRPGYTPVYRLDTHSYRLEIVETEGDMPGWISSHRAWCDGDAILIEGGECAVEIEGEQQFVQNTARWRLDLSSRTWQ